KDYIRTWSERPIQLHEIEDDIGNFLSERAEQYDFIHLSHVIEHIPKQSLLDSCGFDDIRFHRTTTFQPTLKQRAGALVRSIFLKESEIRHRMFGVNKGGIFEPELVVTAKRGTMPPLFDAEYR